MQRAVFRTCCIFAGGITICWIGDARFSLSGWSLVALYVPLATAWMVWVAVNVPPIRKEADDA